jgi:hypothetical protein
MAGLARRPVGEESWIVLWLDALRQRRSIASEAFRATLAGVTGVHVRVEPINADAERDGLRAADLQADVESALREDGVAVHAQSALFASVPGTPVLHVDVMTVGLDGRYAYSIRLELWQGVRLTRDPGQTALAITWSAPQIVGTLASERLGTLRETVRAAVQGFVAECRLATAERDAPHPRATVAGGTAHGVPGPRRDGQGAATRFPASPRATETHTGGGTDGTGTVASTTHGARSMA